MGKHSANKKGSTGRRRPRGGAAERQRFGLRALGDGPANRRRAHGLGDEPHKVRGSAGSRPASLEHAPARLKAERDRRRARYRKIALAITGALGVLAIAVVVGAWAWLSGLQSEMIVKDEKLAPSLEKAKPQEPFTVLLLGGDRRRDEPYRTDTMIFARIDPRSKQVWLLSIPRDTRVEIEGRGAVKANAAFTYGGVEGAIAAVKDLTGVPVNHYMHVDFKGFKKAVDALGGIWINVPVEIDDVKAASHNRNARHIDAGYQLLDGDHALTFVRARHQFSDQDFSRMKNQQIFFKALADQIAEIKNIAKVPRVVSQVAPYVKTDMSLMDMVRSAQALRGAGGDNVFTATLEGEWRSPFVYLDEEKNSVLIERMLAGEPFEKTKAAEEKNGDGSSAGASDAAAGAEKPSNISVTVRNGAGISGCASQASSILKARGFQVGEVGNAAQFVYGETLVVFKERQANAALVSEALPPGARLVESRGMYSFDSDVLVVVGKDWDLAKVPTAPISTQ